MTLKLVPAVALVAALGVAACDNSEYETQIGDLQGQLETARGEVTELETQLAEAQSGLGEIEQMRMELEQARERIQELESQPVAAAPQPSAAEEPTETDALAAAPAAGALQQPLEGALSALQEVDRQLVQLRDALVGEGYENLEVDQPRSLLNAAARNIVEAAQAAGVELEAVQQQ